MGGAGRHYAPGRRDASRGCVGGRVPEETRRTRPETTAPVPGPTPAEMVALPRTGARHNDPSQLGNSTFTLRSGVRARCFFSLIVDGADPRGRRGTTAGRTVETKTSLRRARTGGPAAPAPPSRDEGRGRKRAAEKGPRIPVLFNGENGSSKIAVFRTAAESPAGPRRSRDPRQAEDPSPG